jgi:hypothetical protein
MVGSPGGTEQVPKFVLTALNIHARKLPAASPKSMGIAVAACIGRSGKNPNTVCHLPQAR